jgi:hypothetical protein
VLADAPLEEKVGIMSARGFFTAIVEDDRLWARGLIAPAA